MSDDTDTTDSTEQPPEFAAMLLQHARGRSHDELSAKFAELVRAVMATGKGGSLTYKVRVSPAKGVEGMVRIEDQIGASVPQLDRPASMFFADADGRLSQDHPHQQSLFRSTEGQPR